MPQGRHSCHGKPWEAGLAQDPARVCEQQRHSALEAARARCSVSNARIPDLTSDTIGQAYLGMTAIGKQRKIAIALDGSETGVELCAWAIKYALTTSDQVHLLPLRRARNAGTDPHCHRERTDVHIDNLSSSRNQTRPELSTLYFLI